MDFIIDRVSKWIGREVVLEGIFPIPVPSQTGMQVIYSPIKGKLVGVYKDGFELMEDGDGEPTLYPSKNIRSIHPISEIARVKPNRLIT